VNLIVIYGPPGVGKLTVSKSLSRITGYRVFHNHLTIDLVGSIFEWRSRPYNRLVDKLRLDIVEEAARERIPGVILTMVYAKGIDDAFFGRLARAVERHQGRVVFVRLTCSEDILYRRIKQKSRKAFGKIRGARDLRQFLKDYKCNFSFPHGEGLTINNSGISSARAAKIIKAHYGLRAVLRKP
jgi:AAA domain